MININKLVANSIVITTGPVVKETTVVKYTTASGRSDWEGDIVGELVESSIPNVADAEVVEIGSHVTSIGDAAFYNNCIYLTSVTIPDSVTIIKSSAFEGCSSLTSVEMPNSVTSIGWGAFSQCYRLTSVTIGNSVTSIGDNAFFGCNFTNLAIPNSVISIGQYAFSNIDVLKNMTFSGKTKATVQGMDNYDNWGLPSGCILHCTDGDITLP